MKEELKSFHNPCPYGNDDCPKCNPKEEWEIEFDEEFDLDDYGKSTIVQGKVKQFISNLLKKQKQSYSVSEWKRIGIERGYWNYFKQEIKGEIFEIIEQTIREERYSGAPYSLNKLKKLIKNL